ncbi:MAG: Ig-like domain-containing protein [Chloroflexota bacterium]
MKKMARYLALSLVILLLLLSCRSEAPTPEPEPAPTEEAQVVEVEPTDTPAPTATPLPATSPIVLHTAPEVGEEQALDAPIEITFDQPMDRDSVEKAFAIEPGASVDGEFDWIDDQTLQFSLKEGFERGERYKIRVVETAESQVGMPMLRPFELRFSAVGFLEVTNVQPAADSTEILPDTVVTVLFNRPVVPLNAIEDGDSLPDPLTFVPPVTGTGTWLNTAIYQFIPDEGGGFEPSTEYTARIAKGLTDSLGSTALDDDFEWTFTTFTPAVIASIPSQGDIYVSPSPVISLTFNQPMDRDNVEENLELIDTDTGESIPGQFNWAEISLEQPGDEDDFDYYDYAYDEGLGPAEIGVETVGFTPNVTLDFATLYRIFLPEGTAGKIGQATTQFDFSADFAVTAYPEVVDTFPLDGDEFIAPWESLQITFSGPMDPDSVVIGENLIIEPTVAVTEVFTYWRRSNTVLDISFPTEASSDYKVLLGPDIEGRFGHQLGLPTRVAWETRAQSPLLFMHSPGRISTYNAYDETVAFVTVRNLERIFFNLYRMPKEDFVALSGDSWWSLWDEYLPAEEDFINTWDVRTNHRLNTNAIYKVDLAEESGFDEDSLPPGMYYLEAFAATSDIYEEVIGPDSDYYFTPERQILVVTKNNITFKSSNSESLAWVTDLESGQPVEDVPVMFMIGEQNGRAKTDDDGVAMADYERRGDSYETRAVFAGDPDDPDENFAVTVSEWADGIDRYQFDNVSTEDYQQAYATHFYTDRNIYRPGQTVNFKGIIREDDDARYSLPTESNSAFVTVSDQQGKEIFAEELSISEMGTLNSSFALDEDAGLGFYSIQIEYGEAGYFYDEFQVAAYRKPEFLVSVETDQPEYVHGEDVNVTATAEFFFGGPVSNAEVRWTLLSDDYFFRYDGDGFYDFTDYDLSRRNFDNFVSGFGERIAEGEGLTDEEGRFTFEVEADIAEKIASQRYSFDVVVTDVNNQEVASQASAIVHKGLFYIGLQPTRYVGQVDEESEINILVTDWESDPVADEEIQIVFAEHNWFSVQQQAEDGSFYWSSTVETVPVATTTVTSDQDGMAVADFAPESGGVFRIIATGTDSERNEIRSSTFMWVSGRQYVNWRQENNDRLELVTDKREYEVGDTATILVPHPYSGTVQALVTMERGHIYDHFVTELETNSDLIEIPITEAMLPNMYVSVVVVNGSELSDTLPSFKVGYASLPIDTKEKALNITLTPNKTVDEKYQPGETAEYQVSVTDIQGKPVKAELSLALVDKAVLTLSPETPGQLMSTFWRDRGLGVKTSAGLTLAVDRVNLAVAPEAKGGGGGFDEGFGVIRGDFKDTALWVADFVTDEAGEGVVEATLPDNLTTWTLTGKGVTGADTQVGEGTVEIVSTKRLLVRPVAPRFFVVGDEARLGVIVQNNGSDPLDVSTLVEADGLTLEPVNDTDFAIAPNERVKVEYNVTVENVETVSLTMGAKSSDDELGDALTFELPVYRFSTPETVATVGILEEDGTRTEGIALPRSFDPTQGDLTINVDPSLAAGMRDGLDYLEHFEYECTEQTVSRFLPNVFTYRAYEQLNLENPELEARLPGLVSLGLQRLYSQQHFDGGWGWWLRDDSNPFITAYVLLGLIEAQRAGFAVDDDVLFQSVDYLKANLIVPDESTEPWRANRHAFILYALAEAGAGDLGRTVALFNQRQQLDTFGRAYLAMALHLLDDEATQIDTLLNDITSEAIVSATGAHWEEAQVDYYSMNTDTRSTAIIITALSRIQPDNPLLPNAVRWLMSIRENGGHWETTQETAWAIIGLTDWMVTTGELDGEYSWQVVLNGDSLGDGEVGLDNIDETNKLQVEVGDLLADTVNRLAFERNPLGSAVSGSPGNLYYGAYLTYYKPVQEVKALDRGIIVSRQYTLSDDQEDKPISEAAVGDTIEVKLTLIAPNDLHYVIVEDFLPAGAEGVDTSLATTSVVGEAPSISRTDRQNPWGRGYGWWYFSHAELRDEKAVLFATFLPKGTYEYTYQIRASLPGEFNVIPTHAQEMYFPEVFGRGDGGLFTITQ